MEILRPARLWMNYLIGLRNSQLQFLVFPHAEALAAISADINRFSGGHKVFSESMVLAALPNLFKRFVC